MIRTPTLTIGVRGTVFASVTREDGATVVLLQCAVREFRWQPKKQRQCLREIIGEITVTSLTGVEAILDQCGLAVTVLPDGTITPPGPPPDWAVASLEELDELVGDRDNTGGDTGDDGNNENHSTDNEDRENPGRGMGNN